jgi:hypothetical protein
MNKVLNGTFFVSLLNKNRMGKVFSFAVCMCALIVFNGCLVDKGELVDETPQEYCDTLQATYVDTVKILIDTECAFTPGCHGVQSANGDFTTHANMSGVGAFLQGGIGTRVTSTTNPMPPTGLLPDSLRRVIECWARDGYPQE